MTETEFKNVVTIYFDDDWANDLPIKKDPAQRKAFEDWHRRGLKCGVAMFRASIQWFDQAAGVFTKAWAFRDGRWQKINTPVKPDMVFDSLESGKDYEYFAFKKQLAQRVTIYNDPTFRTLVDNKLSQYLMFHEFMPRSGVLNRAGDWPKIKADFKGKLVIKPLYGSGGRGIQFTDAKNIRLEALPYPALVQEFVTSEKGVPGFTKKAAVADLRLVYIDHELIFSLSREAAPGSLLTNYHQGATPVRVPRDKIPSAAMVMADKIVNVLRVFPWANYSLDFIFDQRGRPRFLEMNTTPGTCLIELVGDEALKREYFQKCIIKHL